MRCAAQYFPPMKFSSALPLLAAALAFAGCSKAPETPAAAPAPKPAAAPAAATPAPAAGAPAAAAPTPTAGPRTITIDGSDVMKFSVTSITAAPGEELRIVLSYTGAMPKEAMQHNIVFMQKGWDPDEFVPAAANAKETDCVPPDMASKVIAHSKLVAAGQKTEFTFKAPTEPGEYDYICSWPGHYLIGMKGLLTVKK